jgi:adenylate cyclase
MNWIKLKQFLWEWRSVWITSPSIAGLVILLRLLGAFQSWEWAAFDQYMRWRPSLPRDPRIVIVGIEEADMRYLNQGYIADGVYAKLLTKLKARQPRAIGLDIYRDVPFEPGHAELVKVFEASDNIIGIQKVVGDRNHEVVAPPPALKRKNRVGANDVIADADNTVRRGLIYLQNDQGENFFSFSLYLALLYLEKENIAPEIIENKNSDNQNIWKLGNTEFIPLQPNDGSYIRANTNGYQILLNYRGPRGHFETVPLRDVLQDKVPADWGRDRIILIGSVGESFKDYVFTPHSSGWLSIPQPMSGIEVQANIISQIITSALDTPSLIKSYSEPIEWLWIFLWSGIGGIISWQWRQNRKSSLIKNHKLLAGIFNTSFLKRTTGFLFATTTLFGITYIAFIYGWWIPIVSPLLAFAGSATVITTYIAYTADSIRKIFGRYLSDEVVSTLLESPEGLKLGGKKQQITILTSDLRGFTALSELWSPEEVVLILNIYLEQMLNVITDYQGTVDKFMGDGIVVLFGAPVPRENDAERAVACALAMQLAMPAVNEKLERLGLPVLEMGIGINTGEVIVGNIGSEIHTEYTVIGREMNLVFRIETYSTGNQILISHSTLEAVGTSLLKINEERLVKPKGVKQPIPIYDIAGMGGQYNLFLTKEEEKFLPISQAINIQYSLIEGKQASDKLFTGKLIKISAQGAIICTDKSQGHSLPSPLTNIKLNLIYANEDGAVEISDALYAKVLDKPANNQEFYVRFTFKTPAVAKKLLSLLIDELKKQK